MQFKYGGASLLLALMMSMTLVPVSQRVIAQDTAPVPGDGVIRELVRQHIRGKILTRRHVYYNGDLLEISLRFARGAPLVRNGEVDAWVVIYTPADEQEPVVIPVSELASTEIRRLFVVEDIDLSELPAGQYQLGLIVTIPGGDPLLLQDWYHGLRGLLDIVGIRLTDILLEDDRNRDGFIDSDFDGDGFSDD